MAPYSRPPAVACVPMTARTTPIDAPFLGLFHLREQWVGVVLFTDAGRVTTRPEYLDPLDVTELFWAAGTGLRYNTPVGPLRFDLGYRLNRHGALELVSDKTVWDRIAFHLSIGEAF